MQEQAHSDWDHFVARRVLPAFQAIRSINERIDGTTFDIQQAPPGERWVRLTWKVAPSASVLALLPPSMRTAEPPKTVLIYTITDDERSTQKKAWCETSIPDEGGGPASGSRVFREALGDYRRDITEDAIINSLMASYQRHVLGSEPTW